MYKEISQIQGVSEFIVENDTIAYKDNKRSRKNRSLHIIKEGGNHKIADNITGFQLDNSDLHFSNWSNETFKLNLSNQNITKLQYDQIGIFKVGNSIIYTLNEEIHFESNRYPVLQESEFGNKKLLTGAILFSTNSSNNVITSLSLKGNVKLKWSFSIDKYGSFKNLWQEEVNIRVNSIIGLWNNQLLLQLNNGNLISLNSDSGNLLWTKENIDNNQTAQEIGDKINSVNNPFLDKASGKVFLFQGEHFIVIDLAKKEASALWHSKDHNPNRTLFIKQPEMENNKIYFTSSIFPNLGNCNTVGIFDVEKYQVIWQHSLNFDNSKYIQNKIQVGKKHIYFRDSEDILYVFAKEK